MTFFIVVLLAGNFVTSYGPARGIAWSFESRVRCEEVMSDVVGQFKNLPDGITIKCVTEPVFDAIVAAGKEEDI